MTAANNHGATPHLPVNVDYPHSVCAITFGKTTVSMLHDAQLLLSKQQQIWGGVYIH